MKFYMVGGFVRDDYMNRMGIMKIKAHDRDYAVEANSYEEMRDYINAKGKIYLETPKFFTIRAKMPEMGDADFVLCRKDGVYSDGRRPDTVEPGTIYDDLARRDFTMNAIAIDESGNYIDPYNGREHISSGVIYCVNDTIEQLTADSLRMFRAIRFSVTKEMGLYNSISLFLADWNNYKLLDNISSDRIKDEMNKMWEYNPILAFSMMNKYKGLFTYVFQTKNIWMKATMEKR